MTTNRPMGTLEAMEINRAETTAALIRRRRLYAARDEVQGMFPEATINVMTDIDGHISFERREGK